MTFVFILFIILGLIVYFLSPKNNSPAKNNDDHLKLALSKEDAVSQWLFLLAMLFFGLTLASFNKSLADPLDWKIIILVTSVLGLITAYYFQVTLNLIVSIFGLITWWIAQSYSWIAPMNIKPATKDLKVVMLTNMGQEEVKNQAQELGISGYLIKLSYTPDQLIKAVNTYLE